MITLNLSAVGTEQNIIKEYLQNNANPFLAEKINNGVKITKDNKSLVNKKTLNGFMKYAAEQAKQSVTKGSNYACLHHDIVFGWAMHYFQEDSIIGTLYNEDGSEYKTIVKTPTKTNTTSTTTYTPPVKKVEPQVSLFELLTPKVETEKPALTTTEEVDEEIDEEDMQDALEELAVEEKKPTSPIYLKYFEIQKAHPDSVVAYRLGDFYEVFGDNAVKTSKELDLTLTGRDFGLKERVPMVGFPCHCAEDYFAKISKFSGLVIVDDKKVTIYDKSENLSFDMETGEVSNPSDTNEILTSLLNLFDNNLEIIL